jgi:hypothetical protein
VPPDAPEDNDDGRPQVTLRRLGHGLETHPLQQVRIHQG